MDVIECPDCFLASLRLQKWIFTITKKKKKNLILLMECNLSKKTRKSNKLIQSHDIKFIHSSMGHGMEKKNLAKLS